MTIKKSNPGQRLSFLISSTSVFLEHFRAIACNFDWQFAGKSICAYKYGLRYDPITALIQIAIGEYVGRHHVFKLRMTDAQFDILMSAIYNPDWGNPKIVDLRRDIEEACNLLTKVQ